MSIFCGVVIVCSFIALLGYISNDGNSVSDMRARIAEKHRLEMELVALVSEYRDTDYRYLADLKIKMIILASQLKQIEIYQER